MPKRPAAPYALFQIDERKQNPELYKQLSLETSAKEIAQKWKNMDKQDKNKYMKTFTAQLKSYEKAKQNLKVQLIKGVKVKREKKKAHQPFVAFIKEQYMVVKQAFKTLPHKDIMAKLSEKWRLLTDEQRLEYKKQMALEEA